MALEKAKLIEIEWKDQNAVPKKKGKVVQVQFNPASLQVSYSNQVNTQDRGSKSSMQYVGEGDSKLAVELIFDVSGADSTHDRDVRRMTERVAYFMSTTPNPDGKKNSTFSVPGLRFQWGSFLFDGVLVSMSENLELWSESGNPLRAVVSLSLSQPGIQFQFSQNAFSRIDEVQSKLQAGIRPIISAAKGATLQDIVGRAGRTDWKNVAASNGIENPRNMLAGTSLDLGG